FQCPGQGGTSYYTRKSNYGLNAQQIGNAPSTLHIIDFAHGPTGSAHDASAFEYTCAAKYPDFLFDRDEFAWGDSAYAVTERMICIHKKPAADIPANSIFDKTFAEHCMSALKGCWSCLSGLHVSINSNNDHIRASRWITISIIFHNLIIDLE
ncbi:hypothetical protein GYMLUDRAFT_103622, partial [Collybiopsis luxurians FD-317 M1]